MDLQGGVLQNVGIEPPSPGEFFGRRFLKAPDMTIERAIEGLGVDRRFIVEFLEGHRPVDSRWAPRLARMTGTTPMFWLNMQHARDLYVFALEYKRQANTQDASAFEAAFP